MIKSRSDQRQRYASSRTQFYLLEKKNSSREEIKEKWTIQVEQFKVYSAAHEFYEFDGDAIEFEWEISQNHIIDLIRDPEILTMSER